MPSIRAAVTAVFAALFLAGCVASTAVPLSRTVWRLQVTAEGPASEQLLERRVLREAAAVAFRNGAPYFLLAAAEPEDLTAEAARAILFGDPRLFLIAPGSSGGPTVTATTIVVLLDEDDPRAADAFRTLDHTGG